MAPSIIDFEIKVKGEKELVKLSKRIEEEYVRCVSGNKNRDILNNMRQKLQLMYPGSHIKAINEGGNLKFSIDNFTNSTGVNNNRLMLELSSQMQKLQAKEFEKLKGKKL